MAKEIDFSNPNEEIALVATISGGSHFCVKTTLSLAYEVLDQWKKYVLFASESDPVKRSKMDPPFILYHFMNPQGDRAQATILFQTVLSMQVAPLAENESWRA